MCFGIMVVLLRNTTFLPCLDRIVPRTDTEPCYLEKQNGVGASNSGAALYLPTCTMPKLCIALSKTLPSLKLLGAFTRKGNTSGISSVKSLLSPVALETLAVQLPDHWLLRVQMSPSRMLANWKPPPRLLMRCEQRGDEAWPCSLINVTRLPSTRQSTEK